MEEIRFDVVFLGTDAIDDEGRCLVSTPEEARLAGIMRKAGNKAVLVADHTKLGAIGHIPFSRLEEFDAWITDTGITPEKERAFSEMTSVHTVTPV
ncbi:MAG: DeoR/GlpR transcriptional regulator [Spirochaetaceae bacterium]|nr:MAG: DeoR/GlpR transcriptional regulator [Spirochaetaceae bacterium]